MFPNFLVFVNILIFSCSLSFGQEKIFITKDYKTIKKYVSENYVSQRETTYNNNITLLIEAKDSLDNEHIYCILFKTLKCISQTHIYNDSIQIKSKIHYYNDYTIAEIVQKSENKFYKIYYGLESGEKRK